MPRARPDRQHFGSWAPWLACLGWLVAGIAPAQELPPVGPAPSAGAIAPDRAGPGPRAPAELVADVRVTGNQTTASSKILGYLRTRKDRTFDPELVQADKRRLASTGMFRDVRIYTERVPQGVVVTFEVFERPTIREIRFTGNRGFKDSSLLKESGIAVGDALNVYSIEEARRKIEDFYHTKGYPQAEVVITSGTSPDDRVVDFYISEGPLKRIESVRFVGNTIVSGERLKTKIQSKPGFLWYLFRGKVDEDKIEEDRQKLIAYYRGLGFFRAKISPLKEYDEEGKWLTLTFVIDEGPRYLVRDVTLAGHQRFATDDLHSQLKLKPGEYFNLDKMNADVNALRDTYGSQGFIFADIRANPRFQEEPGQLDLAYSIQEGEQFRVGRINVHIAGEFPHTKESVVRDRLSIRPGDIVDIREVRSSERRLKASQLFIVNPTEGNPPRIVIRPPNLQEAAQIAAERPPGIVRGQSPENRPSIRDVVLDVLVERTWTGSTPEDQPIQDPQH